MTISCRLIRDWVYSQRKLMITISLNQFRQITAELVEDIVWHRQNLDRADFIRRSVMIAESHRFIDQVKSGQPPFLFVKRRRIINTSTHHQFILPHLATLFAFRQTFGV